MVDVVVVDSIVAATSFSSANISLSGIEIVLSCTGPLSSTLVFVCANATALEVKVPPIIPAIVITMRFFINYFPLLTKLNSLNNS